MLNNYLTITEAVAELAREGYPVCAGTLRSWCRKHGFGIRLVPAGPFRIHRSKLAPLKTFSASETAAAAP
jgi:hypothetical protein